jgi:hypothetical protein
LPQSTLLTFQRETGYNSNTESDPNIFVVEPGLYYTYPNRFNGSLIFTLNGGLEVEIPNEELSTPLRGLDQNGKRVLQPNITEVNIFHKEAPAHTAAMLGKIFLSQVCQTPNP